MGWLKLKEYINNALNARIVFVFTPGNGGALCPKTTVISRLLQPAPGGSGNTNIRLGAMYQD